MQQRTSQDWVDRLSAGGEQQREALSDLREVLLGRLRRALASNRKVDDAFLEDVVQEGLVTVLGTLEQFQGRSQFTTWATTITLRIAFTEMRRARWKDVSLEQMSDQGREGTPRDGWEADAATRFQGTQLIETMHDLIQQKLTDKQRTALLAELRGVPQQEIGRHLGSNRNAVYKLTHDARKRLKAGLIDAGYSAEDLDSLSEVS